MGAKDLHDKPYIQHFDTMNSFILLLEVIVDQIGVLLRNSC